MQNRNLRTVIALLALLLLFFAVSYKHTKHTTRTTNDLLLGLSDFEFDISFEFHHTLYNPKLGLVLDCNTGIRTLEHQ